MAALLYDLEEEGEPCAVTAKGENSSCFERLEEIVKNMEKDQLCDALLKYAQKDKEIAYDLRRTYGKDKDVYTPDDMRHDLNRILDAYINRHGYVYGEDAFDFCNDLESFTETKGEELIQSHQGMTAFIFANESIHTLQQGYLEDGDGDPEAVINTAYDLWNTAYEECNEIERAEMNTLLKNSMLHADDGPVLNYAEEFIYEHFASEEEIRERMSCCDQRINEDQASVESPVLTGSVFCKDCVTERIRCMERLGMSQDEIDAWKKKNRRFHVIRRMEIEEAKKAQEADRCEELILESIIMDADHTDYVKELNEKLIEVYAGTGNKEGLKEALHAYVLNYPQKDREYYHMLRDLMDQEERQNLLQELIENSGNLYWICGILYEEKEYDLLMTLIEKYGKMDIAAGYKEALGAYDPERVIAFYAKYLQKEALCTGRRSHYEKLMNFLEGMLDIRGGREEAERIAQDWRVRYAKRPAMMEMLNSTGI